MTSSSLLFKLLLLTIIVLCFALAGVLWGNTPELFDYFNQAFCAH